MPAHPPNGVNTAGYSALWLERVVHVSVDATLAFRPLRKHLNDDHESSVWVSVGVKARPSMMAWSIAIRFGHLADA